MKGISLKLFAILVCAMSFSIVGLTKAHAANTYRPVVFVPGTLGSTLKDKQGNIVWGSIGAAQKHFEKLSFPLTDPQLDEIEPVAILNEMTLWLGWIKVQAYKPITSYLESEVGAGKFFQFAYDWRQSNFASACDLKKFIDSNAKLKAAAEEAAGISLVTHSMGGLVGRIFLDNYVPQDQPIPAGNKCLHHYNVRLFLPIAAPFEGAGQALKNFTDGLGGYWKLIRSDPKAAAKVFFTIPSVYELLPRYKQCCATKVTGQQQEFDPLSKAVWDFHGWIRIRVPEFGKDTKFQTFLSDSLSSANRLAALISKPIERAHLFSISGVRQKTATYVSLGAIGGPAAWSNAPDGDDTVPFVSANAAEKTSTIVPNTHLGLLADDRVHKLIRFAIHRYGDDQIPLASGGDDIPDELAPYIVNDLAGSDAQHYYVPSLPDLNPYVEELTSQTITLRVESETGDPVGVMKTSDIKVSIQTHDGTKISHTLTKIEQGSDFRIRFVAPKAPAIANLRIVLPKGPSPIYTELNELFSIVQKD